jgi:8-oxo-dGTP pyrophosphatase MutT (NUDIX family)
VALVILHTREIDQNKVLLQQRSIFNSVDAEGKYSNISGRLCVSDVARPENVQEFYREVSKIGRALPPRQESSLATDIFSNVTGFQPEVVVTDEAWMNAAIREVREELGLTIEKSDLDFQASYNLTGQSLCFRIYSLQISMHQLQEIKKRRPHAGLEPFGRSQLIEFHKTDRFNRLLQNKFEEVFIPIFDKLNISA